ncbi:MAG: hypothetical protein HKN18_03760 [Silicimonas sp.]|nr:hypothetical protein [Silicimonas sp.]
MSLDVLIYRVTTLWKVIVVGSAFPVATVWLSSMYHGTEAPLLMALAVLIPTVHALRYPGLWHETVTVSLILSLCLCLAAMIEPGLTIGELVWRFFWLCVLALILFLVAVTPMSMMLQSGRKRLLTGKATKRSSLDVDSLRAAITLYPGRESERTWCGPADADGRFPVTINAGAIELVQFEIEPDHLTAVEDPDDDEDPVFDEDGNCAVDLYAVVHASTPERHEVFTYVEPDEVGVLRHSFLDLGEKGTEVTVEETGHYLTTGQIFGFWLVNCMTDYLTHELDLAEGRRPRANRAFPQKQLVVDLANLILPMLGGKRIEKPGV